MRKQDGFSLIELMVVVAIIGILAAIAIPQLDGFRQKARASEAKTSLGTLYTAEKTYFYETGLYSGRLDVVGYKIEGADRAYTIGFVGVNGTPASSVFNALRANATAWPTSASACTATAGTSFLAGAFGDSAVLNDYANFSIDNDKDLKTETAVNCT